MAIIGKKVIVGTSNGKEYQGDLVGIDEKMNIILDKVTGADRNVFKVILNGDYIKEIRLIERPFDLKALADRLGRVFPGLIRLHEDIGTIMVMEKIKVTEQGVVEGTGLAAERVKSVYEEFIREGKK